MSAEEEKIESLNRTYKNQKKLGLIGSDVSFKDWITNIFNKDKGAVDSNPKEPTDYSDKKMNIQIFGINAWVIAGAVVGVAAVFFVARHYYIKSHKLATA